MSRLRELLSDSLIYGLSGVVARFLNYLLVPLYTGVFAPGEYGVVGLVYGAVVFLNVVYTLGLESAYIRHAADRERAPDVFKTLQFLLMGAGVVLTAGLLVAEPWARGLMQLDGPEAGRIFGWVLLMLSADALTVVPFAELRLAGRAWWFAGLKTLHVALNIGLNLVCIFGIGMGIEAVFLSNAVASAVVGTVVWIRTWPMLAGRWRGEIAREALWFGLPYVPNGIGFAINEVLDRFWISRMDPDTLAALYGEGVTAADATGWYNACYKIGVFMLLLVQMFRMAWQPFFMKHAAAADAPDLFARVFTAFNTGAALIFIGIGLFAPEIAALRIPGTASTLIDARYWDGLVIVPWILAAYWFQGWFVTFSVGVFLKDRTKRLPFITGVGAVVTVVANAVLVPMAGITGAAVASAASALVMAVLLLADTRKSYPVGYALGPALATLGLAVGVVWAGAETEWPVRAALALGAGAGTGLIAWRASVAR